MMTNRLRGCMRRTQTRIRLVRRYRICVGSAAVFVALSVTGCGWWTHFHGTYGYQLMGAVVVDDDGMLPEDATIEVVFLAAGEAISLEIGGAPRALSPEGSFSVSQYDSVSAFGVPGLVALDVPEKPSPDQVELTVTYGDCDHQVVVDIGPDTVATTDFGLVPPDNVIELLEPIVVPSCR